MVACLQSASKVPRPLKCPDFRQQFLLKAQMTVSFVEFAQSGGADLFAYGQPSDSPVSSAVAAIVRALEDMVENAFLRLLTVTTYCSLLENVQLGCNLIQLLHAMLLALCRTEPKIYVAYFSTPSMPNVSRWNNRHG